MARGKRKVRVGLIGCGGWMRKRHIPQLQADGAVEIVGIAEPSEPCARATIEMWPRPIPWYTSYKDLIRKHEMDGVLIVTPHNQHFEQAGFAMKSGLHVLVEKPLCPSARQVKGLLQLANDTGRILEVAYQRHFSGPFVHSRRLIRRGELGELRGIAAYVTQYWIHAGGWRMDPIQSGGGMLIDTGSHIVAVVLWLAGLRPVEVMAVMDNCGRPVDINAAVSIRFENGSLATINTFGMAGRHDERVSVHGSAGTLLFDAHEWQTQAMLHNGRPIEVPRGTVNTTPDLAWLDYMRTGGKGYELPLYTYDVARVTEAAYRSARLRQPVRLGPPLKLAGPGTMAAVR